MCVAASELSDVATLLLPENTVVERARMHCVACIKEVTRTDDPSLLVIQDVAVHHERQELGKTQPKRIVGQVRS